MNTRTTLLILSWVVMLLSMAGVACQSGTMSAASLYIQQDDWTSAERILQDEIVANPNNAEAWFMLGTIAKHNGVYTSAVYRFEEAARLDTTMREKCATEIDSIPSEVEPN